MDTPEVSQLAIPMKAPEDKGAVSTSKSIVKTTEKLLASVNTPEEYCDRAGINLLDIYRELGDIALHAEIMAKDKYGDAVSLGKDVRGRMTAIALILELNKHIKDKSIVTQVGIFNDPAFVQKATEDAQRILKMMDR